MNGALAGTKNGRAKLTTRKVRSIREHWQLFGGRQDLMMGAGRHNITSATKLAKQYGVSASTVTSIVLGHTWKGV